ncbi:MAG: NAD(P)/FAD-dependent oxidoreductase [Candidatus Neomarinimicrobiota bacterium]
MYDLVIIGAGAVGLCIARYFQVERGWQCLVVEKEADIGRGISSRNSEVIHAGLYYLPGSLKANLCVEGKEQLYKYLERNNLPFRRCGKYVIASPDQEAELRQLAERGSINGVTDLELVEGKEIRRLYDQLSCYPALYSPSSGILSVDSWLRHLAGEFQAAGGDLVVLTRFTDMTTIPGGYDLVMMDAGGDTITIQAERVVNAAGLDSLDVANQLGFDYAQRDFLIKYCKGSYFKVPAARGLFRHLIYPLPDAKSLGIHVCLDLLDEVGLGPDAQYLAENVLDYTIDPSKEDEFRRQVCRYWPAVDQYILEPDWAGIRPHLFVGGEYHTDFYIAEESSAGCPGWVNLFGIDSPGLTAAPAMGPYLETLWG